MAPTEFNKVIKKLGNIKCNAQLYCPPILDRDPKLAASTMTIQDSEEALEKLTYCYEVLDGKKESKYKLLEVLIMNSATNFDWFAQLTTELAELVKDEAYFPPMWLKPESKPNEYLYIVPPLVYKQKKVKELKLPDFLTNTIDKNRYLYIKKQVQLEDFRRGYPVWYALSNMTLFEKYNVLTNVRIRIDFNKGEFRYYISGASDNWKEICDVPLEMDHIVSALLFRD